MRRLPLLLLFATACGTTLQDRAACLGIDIPALPDGGGAVVTEKPQTGQPDSGTASQPDLVSQPWQLGTGRLVRDPSDCAVAAERLLGGFRGFDTCGCSAASAVGVCSAQISWYGSKTDCVGMERQYGYRLLEAGSSVCTSAAAYNNWVRVDAAALTCSADATGDAHVESNGPGFYCPTGGKCLKVDGLVACPAGYSRTTWAQSFVDTRRCACACAAKCAGVAELFAEDGICDNVGFPNSAGCAQYPSVRTARYSEVADVAVESRVEGELDVKWATVCCPA